MFAAEAKEVTVEISLVADWYLTEETLKAASIDIINFASRIPGSRVTVTDQKQNPNPLRPNAPPVKHQSGTTQAPRNDIVVVNGVGQITVIEAKKVIDRLRDPAFVAEQLSAVNRLR